MSDPVRWRDDDSVPEEIRALLSEDAAPPKLDDRTRQAAAALATTLVASKAAAAGGALTLKLVIALVAVAAVGGGVWVAAERGHDVAPQERDAVERDAVERAPRARARRALAAEQPVEAAPVEAHDEAPPEAPRASVPPAPSREEAVDLLARGAPSHACGRGPGPCEESSTLRGPPRAGGGALPRARSSTASEREEERSGAPSDSEAAAPTSTQHASATSGDAIAREAELLEQARAALAGDPGRALSITEQHAREHPQGQLVSERELIAVDALLRLGRRDEAQRRADAMIARAPNGIYARRLTRLLASPP